MIFNGEKSCLFVLPKALRKGDVIQIDMTAIGALFIKIPLTDEYNTNDLENSPPISDIQADNAALRKVLMECRVAMETAEAEIAVYSVTAYGMYQHNLASLVDLRNAQNLIEQTLSKGKTE